MNSLDYNYAKPGVVNYQAPSFSNTGILGTAPAWTAMMKNVQTQLPGGANSKIPVGYSAWAPPAASSGYDNKNLVYDWLNDPKNGALNWDGTPVSGVDGTQEKSFFIPNSKLDAVPVAHDNNPNVDESALGPLTQLASIAAMFVPGLQPLAAGLNVAGGLDSGNIGQAIGGALNLPGVGSTVNGFIGSELSNLGVPAGLLQDATRGVIGAGTTALSGGTLGQSLTNGLAAGAGNEVGSYVSKALGASFSPNVAGTLGTAAGAATSSAIKGGNPARAALMAGINGAVNGAASSLTPLISGALGISTPATASSPGSSVSSDNPLTASLTPTRGNKMSYGYGGGSYSGYAGNYGADVGSASTLQQLGFSASEIDALLGTNTAGGSGIAGPSSGGISGSTTPDMSGISMGGLPAIDPKLQAAVHSGKYTPTQLSAMIDAGVFSGTPTGGGSNAKPAAGGGLGGLVAGALNSLLGTSMTGSGISSGIGTIGALLAAHQALQGNKGAVSNNSSALSTYGQTSPYFNASLGSSGGGGTGTGGSGLGSARALSDYLAPSWYPKSYDDAFAPSGGAHHPMGIMAINGGAVPQDNGGKPMMYAKGGLAQLRMPTTRSMSPMPSTNPPRLVQGPGGGQDDNVHARLSPGEYIMDADAVSALGDGSNEAGAQKLDQMRESIRVHKRSAPPTKIPPKAKGALSYLPKGGV